MSSKVSLTKLLNISAEIDSAFLPLSDTVLLKMGHLLPEYEYILKLKNGFFAFESALQFFHSGSNLDYIDVNA